MKKILSLLLILSVICGLMPQIAFSAAEDFYYFESFENLSSTGMPEGWTAPNYKPRDGQISEVTNYIWGGTGPVAASHGVNALYVFDDDPVKNANHNHSGKFAVTPGDSLGIMIDALMVSGTIQGMIRYYNASNTMISSTTMSMSSYEYIWRRHEKGTVVPENAVTAEIWIYTNSTSVGEGYFDNIRIVKDYVYVKSENEFTLDPPAQATAQNGKLIEPNGDKLVYNVYDEVNGDKLSDFSYAGYYAGEIELPDSSKLSQFATISPEADETTDVTKAIQTVLDEANAEYTATGKVQVVTLKRGKYYINSTGLKPKSGVIIRGEGQDEDGTVIYAFKTSRYNVIAISGSAPTMVSEKAYVTDTYIPAGSSEISIEPERISDYHVGDLITINHPNDDEWNYAIDMKGENMTYTYPMDDPDYAGQTFNTSWDAGDINVKLERTIKKIEGNTITVDFPFFVPYDTRYSKMYVQKTDDSGRRHDIGIENLRIESTYNGDLADDNHANVGIYFTNAKNCYVRDVSSKYVRHSVVHCQNGTKQVTVKNVSCLQPVCPIAGGNRYSFYTGKETQQIIMIGCYSYDGRHDYCTSYHSTGPTVFADSVIDDSNAQSETHGSWSTGALYDNILSVGNTTKGYIASTNRGVYGTRLSQGWSGAGIIAWNCLAPAIMFHKPPLTYQNFMIGQWGFYDDISAAARKETTANTTYKLYKTNSIPAETASLSVIATKAGTSFVGDAYKESEFAPVEPRSLYKAQLAERITGNYKNFRPNAPVITHPRSENKEETNTFIIKGLYQRGASKVTLYVDNKAYNTTLNTTDYTFSLEITLEDGTHKVYATQTIDGVESTKCADRFIHVKKAGNRKAYLSSDYNRNFISVLTNDTRLTYDEYELVKNNLDASISKDSITHGETAKISIKNSSKYSDVYYVPKKTGIVRISENGVVTPVSIGTVEIEVSGVSSTGERYYDKVSVTTIPKEITINSINFTEDKVDVSGVVEGDDLSFEFKYKLKVPGITNSVATVQKVIISGDNSELYFSNSSIDVEIPSDIIRMKGEGTVNNPYIIDTAYKFENAFSDFSEASYKTGKYHYLQTADIEIKDFKNNIVEIFSGSYKGGEIINGEVVYKTKKITVKMNDGEGASLFGMVANSEIENIDVYGKIENTFSGSAPFAYSVSGTTIKNCNSYVDISGVSYSAGIISKTDKKSHIINCNNYGNISGAGYVGGIVGYNAGSGTVVDCKNNAVVTGTSNYVGGITGYHYNGTIENCENNGNIKTTGYIGGIAGRASGVIISCVNNGNITATSSYSGGIAARTTKDIINCVNNGNVTSSSSYVGGITGLLYQNCSVILCENYGAIIGANYVGGVVGDVTKDGSLENTVTKIEKSANYGEIKGSKNYIGGIVGYVTGNDNTLVISQSFNKGRVAGVENVGGIAGMVYYGSEKGTGLEIYDVYNYGRVAAEIADSKGSAVGVHSGAKGVKITNFYDTVNEIDSVGKIAGYTVTEEVIIPAPVVTNAYTIVNGAYTYSEVITVNKLKQLISEGKLSDEIWKNDSISGYPLVKWSTESASINYIDSLAGHLISSKAGGNLYIASYNEDGALNELKIYDISKPGVFEIKDNNKVFVWNSNLMPLLKVFSLEGK